MIASLPMYASPHTADADGRLWAGIRDRLRSAGIAAPDHLTLLPGELIPHWCDPALVLSQTCGLPLRAVLWDKVQILGTPDYGIAGCPPGHYCSVVIARADDTRTRLSTFAKARFAYNEPLSQSGWAALALEAPHVLSGPLIRTGSHRASMMAVRAGEADFAAIDAVTWRMIENAGEGEGCQIVHRTRPNPGLPFITAKGQDAAAIAGALRAAIAAMPDPDRAVLGIKGISDIPRAAYDHPIPPTPDSFRR
ncbi:PhnD/SsuA/transferrin family substrate-binding protein [Yoonia sp. BS5-3]|uniref:Phosphate/phosphite/phosphonate ABC transporter substrate-binding protein n=1 Tax=Yoonia phaeophyticola TaxID=3137369 RepID=A0ABZ2V044_9RHOB